ncbi:MAG: type II toxin-antitoxin system HicB family antitoxin [Dehalococcoidia bacterium]|nr:type II toxin-antitoxin system HicB family antitoxin [Dehalococcoidia bacterium]
MASPKIYRLPVVITQDEDGYYVAEVPVLPSCFTQGKTKEEALKNIKEVILLCLESLSEEGGKVPEKYSLEHVEVAVP